MDTRSQQPHDEPARRTYTMREAQRVIGVGESTLRALVRTGALPSIRIGRRVLLPRRAVDDFTASGGTVPTR